MYESFYNLDHSPYPASPDPASLIIQGDLGTHLGELVGCLTTGQGIAVLTGPPGSGKTICTLAITRDLSGPLFGICLRTGSFDQPRDLLKAILHGLGCHHRQTDDQDLRLAVLDALSAIPTPASAVLLAVDEAHRLSWPVLEELRGLTNVDRHGQPLVRLLLVGQHELEEKLADPRLDGLNQRVRAQVRLLPLTRAESAEYLRGRIRFAGGAPGDVLTDEAVELLATVCDGSPSCLNHLADAALQHGAWNATRPITRSEVLSALNESRRLPLRFAEPAEADPDASAASAHDNTLAAAAPVALTTTEDGFCAVEVGARETASVPPTDSDLTVGDEGKGIAWDLASQPAPVPGNGPGAPAEDSSTEPSESSPDVDVDIKQYDVVLPEASAATANDMQPPGPHSGIFSRLREVAARAVQAEDA